MCPPVGFTTLASDLNEKCLTPILIVSVHKKTYIEYLYRAPLHKKLYLLRFFNRNRKRRQFVFAPFPKIPMRAMRRAHHKLCRRGRIAANSAKLASGFGRTVLAYKHLRAGPQWLSVAIDQLWRLLNTVSHIATIDTRGIFQGIPIGYIGRAICEPAPLLPIINHPLTIFIRSAVYVGVAGTTSSTIDISIGKSVTRVSDRVNL